MLDALFKAKMDRWWLPLGRAAQLLGLTPNAVTLLSVILCAINAAAFLWHQQAALFGVLLLMFEALDNVDGALARITHRSTAFGSYLDAVADRYKDSFAIFAIATVSGHWAVSSVLLCGSLLVSYTQARARAEGVMPAVKPLFERLERVLVLVAALIISGTYGQHHSIDILWLGLCLSAVGTHITAVQRIVGTYRALA